MARASSWVSGLTGSPERIAAQVLGDVPALSDVPDDSPRRPAVAGAVVLRGGVGDGLDAEAGHGFSRGRSTERSPATVNKQRHEHGRRDVVVVDQDVQQEDHDDHPDEQQGRHLAGPAVIGRRSAFIAHLDRRDGGGPGTSRGRRARG
jgi:hypothetical protein